ncbi:MerR family transcriptional regulator [Paenibacillus sp. 1_12]|uniref:MerR family transcriptional regulator n=1 Tax=Paenibacillus sp. 1_12 TaxID=1566278 RepID=UPI003528F6E4
MRYYEKEKITKPDRDASGDRRYNSLHLRWLQFVIKLTTATMPTTNPTLYQCLLKKFIFLFLL